MVFHFANLHPDHIVQNSISVKEYQIFVKAAKTGTKVIYLWKHSKIMKNSYILIAAILIWLSPLKAAVPEIQFNTLKTENSGLSHNFVKAIAKDSLGFVWIGTTNGLNRYDGHTIRTYWQGEDGLASSYINEIFLDDNNRLWVRTDKDICWYDFNSDRFINATNNIFETKAKLYTARKEYITSKFSQHFKYPNTAPRCITVDDSGRMWIGTHSGIYIFDPDDGKIRQLINDPDAPFSLSDNRITAIFTDSKGEVWVGTRSGVYYSDRMSSNFKKVTKIGNKSLQRSYVNSFAADKGGQIWIGTENVGILTYNIIDGKSRVYSHPAIPEHSLGIRLLNDRLWIITSDGLICIDQVTGKSRTYRTTLDGRRLGYARDVCYGQVSGNLFASTNIGVFRYDPQRDGFIFMEEFGPIYTDTLLENSKGELWVSTLTKGVIRFNPDTKEVKTYAYDPGKHNSLPCDRILSAYEDADGNMWLCTFGKGICRLDESTDTFTCYNSKTLAGAFINDICYSIESDVEGNFWIGTNKGIIRFNPKTLAVNNFTEESGLLNNENTFMSKIHLPNDDFFYGTADGFTIFNSRKVLSELNDTKVLITDFHINEERICSGECSHILKNHIDVSKQLNLKPEQNNLSFTMAMIGSRQHGNSIEYRLRNHSDIWMSIGMDNRIQFSNIPPGDYVLEFRNSSSTCSRPVHQSINIHIDKPFYQSRVAILLYILAIIAFISIVILILDRRNKQKERKRLEEIRRKNEKNLLDEKMAFLSNIVHEIKTPLTLITSPLSNIRKAHPEDKDTNNDIKIISNATAYLLELSNELREYVRVERKGYRLEFNIIDLNERLRSICFNYTENAKAKGIEFVMEFGNEPIYVEASYMEFNKIINNLLINAFKYCGRSVKMKTAVTSDKCRAIVSFCNDGERIPKEWHQRIFKPFMRTEGVKLNDVDGIGLGLPLARSLAELHSGSLTLNENNESCTEFLLSLPLSAHTEIETEADTGSDAKYSILIAEDNSELRDYLMSQFAKHYRVYSASDGVSAIKCLHEHNIDLLISDISMPRMDGVELCRTIREDMEISHVMIIIISGRNDMKLKIACAENGANLYLEKPLDINYLNICISNLLDKRYLLQKAVTNSLSLSEEEDCSISRQDRKFITKINELILSKYSDPNFSVKDMEEAMFMSNPSLLRKFKRLLNTTPNNYLRAKRLIIAAQMIDGGETRISDVCYSCGFNSTAYFTKCFRNYYGMTPQEYIRKK